MTVVLFLGLLTVHWLADFALQTDKMAINKSTSNWWLTIHVSTYTGVLFTVTVFHPLYAVVNGILHWVTDYFTSRWTSRLFKAGRRHDFFVVVGFDQLVHAWCLGLTALWLM